MTLSMYQASVPVFRQLLTALSGVLDKAAAHAAARKIDPTVLLGMRLAPDMFALTRQVQVAADFAKNTTARLAGVEPVKMEDNEKTIDELKARIAKTLEYIGGFTAAQIDGSEDRELTIPMRGEPVKFKGQPYLLHFAMPNFYFHTTTAYAILRHAGFEIGKRDFVGQPPV